MTAQETASRSQALLVLRDVRSGYGRATVLFDVSLTLQVGEVVALLGRNGAGKSTTLKTIMGLVPATSGTVTFAGRPIAGLPPYRIARSGLGYVPETRRIFTDLTVSENLDIGRRKPSHGRAPWTPETLYEVFPNLAEMRGRRAGYMSGGEQQMLTIARTLMGNPRAVLLDEPSEGIAPVIVDLMARAVLRMKAEGIAVLLSEQNVGFAAAISDRAYFIDRGQVGPGGSEQALLNDDVLREARHSVL